MHVDEIARKLDSSIVDDEALRALSGKVSSALAAHVQSAAPKVARVPNGQGSYRKGYYKAKRVRVQAPVIPVPETSELSTNYVGKAGEHAVMSELLFWGFNVSLMAVDEGIDVIATKDNKYFHIQVKTTGKPDQNGNFRFSNIEREKFERNNAAHTFYILVMRNGAATNFLVLPSSEIGRLISRGILSGSARNLSIKLSVDPATKQLVLNDSENVQAWVNGFKFIK